MKINNGPFIPYSVSISISLVCVTRRPLKVTHTAAFDTSLNASLHLQIPPLHLSFPGKFYGEESRSFILQPSPQSGCTDYSPPGVLGQAPVTCLSWRWGCRTKGLVRLVLFFDHISPYVVLHTSIRRCVMSDLFDSRCVISGVTGLGDHHLDPFILQG